MKTTLSIGFTLLLGISSLKAQVGIGTSSPSETLDLEADGATIDVNSTGSDDPEISFQLNGTSTFTLGIDNSDADKFKIGTTDVATSTFMTINSSGDIGIGNSSPAEEFHLTGDLLIENGSTSPGSLFLRENSTNGSNYVRLIAPASIGTDFTLTLPTDDGEANEIMYTDGSGNLEWTPFLTFLEGVANFTSSIKIGDRTTGTLSSAIENTAVGVTCLDAITSGVNNSALGYGALGSLTTGYNNEAIGHRSGASLTSGYSNVLNGSYSGYSLATGNRNTLIGYEAGYSATGSNNVSVGYQAGRSGGDNNTSVGYQAGYLTTGSNNVFIGYNAGLVESGSNLLFIDNSSTSNPLIYGDFSNDRITINGSNNTRTLFVNGDAGGTGAWNNDSDARLKKDITTINNALVKVQSLRGVNYYWNDTTNHDTGLQMGFIAQEAEEVIPS